MERIEADLAQTFCEDCHARMRRLAEIVQAGAPFVGEQLDQIHQEYDSLLSGARVVLPEREYYFRSMARYARYLRNRQQAGKVVDGQDWEWLLLGIKTGWRCEGELSNDVPFGCREEDVLLQNMMNKVDKGETA